MKTIYFLLRNFGFKIKDNVAIELKHFSDGTLIILLALSWAHLSPCLASDSGRT